MGQRQEFYNINESLSRTETRVIKCCNREKGQSKKETTVIICCKRVKSQSKTKTRVIIAVKERRVKVRQRQES